MNYEEMRNEKFSFIYFSLNECNVCKAIKPKVEALSNKYEGSTYHYINLNEKEEAKGEFLIFAVPAILVYSKGKELLREARFLNFKEIEINLDRYYNMIFKK